MNLVKKQRPRKTEAQVHKIEVGCGHLYVTIGKDKGDLIEIFTTLGKAGGCAMSQLEALSRSVSLGLKFGIPVEEYIKEFENIRCPSPALSPTEVLETMEEVRSCADAIAKVLKRETERG